MFRDPPPLGPRLPPGAEIHTRGTHRTSSQAVEGSRPYYVGHTYYFQHQRHKYRCVVTAARDERYRNVHGRLGIRTRITATILE